MDQSFNAEVFVAAPHAVAMEFDLFGERRSSHSVKGGGVSKKESGGVIRLRIVASLLALHQQLLSLTRL